MVEIKRNFIMWKILCSMVKMCLITLDVICLHSISVFFSVVVVSAAEYNNESKEWLKRAITASSFGFVSREPQGVSFCTKNPRSVNMVLIFPSKTLQNKNINKSCGDDRPTL